jgi:hypothetical protein
MLDFVLDFGRHVVLGHFWPDNADQIAEDATNQVRSVAHPFQFVGVLNSPKAFDNIVIGNPTDVTTALGIKRLLLCNREPMRRKSHSEAPPVAPQRLGNCPNQSVFGYVDASARYFFPCLEGVPAVGKERAARCFNEQECCASGETAKVADVGEE